MLTHYTHTSRGPGEYIDQSWDHADDATAYSLKSRVDNEGKRYLGCGFEVARAGSPTSDYPAIDDTSSVGPQRLSSRPSSPAWTMFMEAWDGGSERGSRDDVSDLRSMGTGTDFLSPDAASCIGKGRKYTFGSSARDFEPKSMRKAKDRPAFYRSQTSDAGSRATHWGRSKSIRSANVSPTSTPQNLGPGSYKIDQKRPNVAPKLGGSRTEAKVDLTPAGSVAHQQYQRVCSTTGSKNSLLQDHVFKSTSTFRDDIDVDTLSSHNPFGLRRAVTPGPGGYNTPNRKMRSYHPGTDGRETINRLFAGPGFPYKGSGGTAFGYRAEFGSIGEQHLSTKRSHRAMGFKNKNDTIPIRTKPQPHPSPWQYHPTVGSSRPRTPSYGFGGLANR